MRATFLSFFCLLAVSSAQASPVTFNLQIFENSGSGQTTLLGTGSVTYELTSVQRQGAFTYVASGGLGLLALDIDVLGSHLTLANAVNGPNMPTLYLDPATLAPGSFELWGAWGNTSTTNGPGFLFSRSFEYDSSAHSYYAARSGDGSSVLGAMPGPGDTVVDGTVVYSSTAPEPATFIAIFTGICAFFCVNSREKKNSKQAHRVNKHNGSHCAPAGAREASKASLSEMDSGFICDFSSHPQIYRGEIPRRNVDYARNSRHIYTQ